MQDYEPLIFAYEVDVQYPDVSGMEHLDMLLTRSRLAEVEPKLTKEQRSRLAKADKILFSYAVQFYTSIARIANLKSWREQESAPPDHWWWYLDVLAAAPVVAAAAGQLVPA
jgi:hypothetical protein